MMLISPGFRLNDCDARNQGPELARTLHFYNNAYRGRMRVASITSYNRIRMGTEIRTATSADVGQILGFVRALAEYERMPHEVVATEADLLRQGFGPNPSFYCLIAEHDGQPAGYALYFFNFSTFLGRPGIFLEDIFIYPEFRDLGIGKALFARLASIAAEKGCKRLQWEVLDWNAPAIDFYHAIGGEFQDHWRKMGMNGEALARWAQEGTRASESDDKAPLKP
jgi:GNAT superfamily N-acetyltransferase